MYVHIRVQGSLKVSLKEVRIFTMCNAWVLASSLLRHLEEEEEELSRECVEVGPFWSRLHERITALFFWIFVWPTNIESIRFSSTLLIAISTCSLRVSMFSVMFSSSSKLSSPNVTLFACCTVLLTLSGGFILYLIPFERLLCEGGALLAAPSCCCPSIPPRLRTLTLRLTWENILTRNFKEISVYAYLSNSGRNFIWSLFAWSVTKSRRGNNFFLSFLLSLFLLNLLTPLGFLRRIFTHGHWAPAGARAKDQRKVSQAVIAWSDRDTWTWNHFPSFPRLIHWGQSYYFAFIH